MKDKLLTGMIAISALTMTAIAAPITPRDMTPGLEAIRKKYDLPALAVVVTKDGEICDRAATGIRKLGDPTPVTTNDVFHIGSCTKSMTATLTAMLIEDGKLRWDTTIGEVFPGLKGKMDRQYERVTVEQLMTHRGGVPGEPPPAAWGRAWLEVGTPAQQRREFIEAVLKEPPAAPPGTQMIYSNQGYTILGAMLEQITGVPWETLVTERLFKPLHMDTAGFGPPGTAGLVDEPWGHTTRLGGVTPVQLDNPTAIGPAGRVHCSLDDLARYTMFHMESASSPKLLKPETLARLHTVPGAPGAAGYACGWIVTPRGWAGGNALYHNGSNTMWYVIIWAAPLRNFSVVVGTNIFSDGAQKACDDVAVMMVGHWLQGK